MRFKVFFLFLIAIFIFGGCAGSMSGTTTEVTTSNQNINEIAKYKGPKARIAVASFKCKAAKCGGQIGTGVSDMLTTTLFNSGKFIVVERNEEGFSAIQKELALAQGGAVQQNRKFSNLEGADILVIGAITAFEPKASGIGGGGLVIPANIPLVGGLKLEKDEAYIAVDIRLLDVSTGRVVNATTVEGKASKWNIGALGGGMSGSVILGGGLSTYKNTPMEKAIRVMLNDAVDKISKLVPDEYYRYTPKNQPISSSSMSDNSSSFVSNQGQESQFELVFKEDFEKYGIGQIAPFGVWSRWKGEPKVVIGVQGNKQTGKMVEAGGKIINKNIKIKDFKLTVDVFSKSFGEPVIYFRVSNTKPYTFYALKIGYYAKFELIKVAGNSQRVIASNKGAERWWKKITIIVKDSNIKVFDGNKVMIDITDNDPYMNKAGNIGIGSAYGVSLIDNLFVYKLK